MILKKNSLLCLRAGVLLTAFFAISCISIPDIEKTDPKPETDPDTDPAPQVEYIYPFNSEAQNVTAEITLQTDGTVDLNAVTVEIPPLKYNKSWLLCLTQDDCRQAAYCYTWAAINGKPLVPKAQDKAPQYYYNASQLRAGDLPPATYLLGKTLGATDGAGNEVRFSFTTTLAPEWDWMDRKPVVDKGQTANFYRFFMLPGLVWGNVAEMCNYGVGIAFHDVNIPEANDPAVILPHYTTSQSVIVDKLSGRGCKFLAEPTGNKAYVIAAQSYAPIQFMTAQNNGSGFTCEPLYPFQVDNDLTDKLLLRLFYDSPEEIKTVVAQQLALPKEQREAILLGVHATDEGWAQLLLWLNNTYGQDGDDSVWMPSQEEYYEYNYYRQHGSVQKTIDGNTLKITLTLPSGQYFYYPALTVNVKGLSKTKVSAVTSSDAVTGLSWGDYAEGVMVNLDCRKHLVSHATHFVEQYESSRTASDKEDALYFVNMLKASAQKQALLQRVK